MDSAFTVYIRQLQRYNESDSKEVKLALLLNKGVVEKWEKPGGSSSYVYDTSDIQRCFQAVAGAYVFAERYIADGNKSPYTETGRSVVRKAMMVTHKACMSAIAYAKLTKKGLSIDAHAAQIYTMAMTENICFHSLAMAMHAIKRPALGAIAEQDAREVYPGNDRRFAIETYKASLEDNGDRGGYARGLHEDNLDNIDEQHGTRQFNLKDNSIQHPEGGRKYKGPDSKPLKHLRHPVDKEIEPDEGSRN